VMAREWSATAANFLPFNHTLLSSSTKASILHYSQYVSDALNGNSTFETAVSDFKTPLPPLSEGYTTGLVTHLHNFEFIWQPPTQRSQHPGGGGIVFIAHACKRLPNEWFSATPDCPLCDPMPIQVNLVNVLRRNGFSVMTMSPVENPAKCWHQNDRKQVGQAMKYVRDATVGFYGSVDRKPPMYAIGVENGGVFLGNYAESLGLTFATKFSAILLMNSGIWHMNMKAATFPPVAFLDLARNGDLCSHNNVTMFKLREKGIPSIQFYSDPRPVSEDYFTPVMSLNQSKAYHTELAKADFLWPYNSVLLKDPTSDYYRRDILSVRVVFLFTNVYKCITYCCWLQLLLTCFELPFSCFITLLCFVDLFRDIFVSRY
jgi:hypothetical protein